MSWLQRIAMSIPEALETLGFSPHSSPSMDEIRSQWKRKIFEHHPDRGGDEATAKMLNGAFTFLQKSYTNNARGTRPPGAPSDWRPYQQEAYDWARRRQRQQRGTPEWQTDERASYNEINEGMGRRNLNYCLKEIYEFSKENGDVKPIGIMAFDGSFFRGSFTSKTNEASLGFAGEVMEDWNSKGANSYPTVAVIAVFGNRVKLIRLRGKDVNDQNIWFEHDSFNLNPGNDPQFLNKMRQL